MTEKICLNKSSDTIFENEIDHARFLQLSSWKN